MIIRRIQTINNQKFTVQIEANDYSVEEIEFMEKFGEPEFDIGGSFTGPPAITQPTNLVRIKSDSPFREIFDFRDDAQAEAKAVVWGDEIIVRLKAEITTLRANMDDFSGESLETF